MLFSKECAISQDSRFGNLSRLLNFSVVMRTRGAILGLSTNWLLVINHIRSRNGHLRTLGLAHSGCADYRRIDCRVADRLKLLLERSRNRAGRYIPAQERNL